MQDKKIYLRFAEQEDLEDLYRWRNDPVTRKSAFNTQKITLQEHTDWFNKTINNPKIKIFIIMNNDKEKIGQVRFNKNQNMAQIDIAIAPNFRGQGYGTLSLTKSCEFYFNNFEIDYIIAKIKKENAASIKAFEKAGFKLYEKKENKVELRLNNPKK